GIHDFCLIDRFHIDIQDMVFLLKSIDILYGKFQYVFIPDGICDHIFMETVTKEHTGGPLAILVLSRIFLKDGGTCKPEHLAVFKESLDGLVGLAELATVALIKN